MRQKYILPIFVLFFFIGLTSVTAAPSNPNIQCSPYGYQIIAGNQCQVAVNDSAFFGGQPPSYYFNYINTNILANASGGSTDYAYINNRILGNLTQIYSSADANYSNLTVYVNNAVAGLGGGNASWNESRGNQLYIRLNNATINNGVPFWYNQTEGTFFYINSNYSASLAYTNTVLQGNLTANITNVYNNINISSTILYNNITTLFNGQFNYSNGTGINLTNGNFSIRLDFLDTIYARIVNFFSKQDIVDMISQNRTAVLNDANVYTNNQIIGNFTANLTAINANLTSSFVPYIGASKNVVLGNNNQSLNRTLEIQGNLTRISNNAQVNITSYINASGCLVNRYLTSEEWFC